MADSAAAPPAGTVVGIGEGWQQMQSAATGLFGIGLVITCLAGFRLLLLIVDLFSGTKRSIQMQGADVALLVLALIGVGLLVTGALLLHQAVPSR